MIGLLCFVLAILASPFKSKLRLEAENAVLRHQLIVLKRRLRGRVRLTNNDRWFFIQLYLEFWGHPAFDRLAVTILEQGAKLLVESATVSGYDLREKHQEGAARTAEEKEILMRIYPMMQRHYQSLVYPLTKEVVQQVVLYAQLLHYPHPIQDMAVRRFPNDRDAREEFEQRHKNWE